MAKSSGRSRREPNFESLEREVMRIAQLTGRNLRLKLVSPQDLDVIDDDDQGWPVCSGPVSHIRSWLRGFERGYHHGRRMEGEDTDEDREGEPVPA